MVNYDRETPYGWRLASLEDIIKPGRNRYNKAVKSAVKSAMSGWKWGIACLDGEARVCSSDMFLLKIGKDFRFLALGIAIQ